MSFWKELFLSGSIERKLQEKVKKTKTIFRSGLTCLREGKYSEAESYFNEIATGKTGPVDTCGVLNEKTASLARLFYNLYEEACLLSQLCVAVNNPPIFIAMFEAGLEMQKLSLSLLEANFSKAILNAYKIIYVWADQWHKQHKDEKISTIGSISDAEKMNVIQRVLEHLSKEHLPEF